MKTKKYKIIPTHDPNVFVVYDNEQKCGRFNGTILECEAYLRLAESNNVSTNNGPIQLND